MYIYIYTWDTNWVKHIHNCGKSMVSRSENDLQMMGIPHPYDNSEHPVEYNHGNWTSINLFFPAKDWRTHQKSSSHR